MPRSPAVYSSTSPSASKLPATSAPNGAAGQCRGLVVVAVLPHATVQEDVVRRRLLEHDHIGVAIVVEIRDGEPARRAAIARDARRRGRWP